MAISLWFGGDEEPDLPAVEAVLACALPAPDPVPLQAFSGSSTVAQTLESGSGPTLDAVSLFATAFVPAHLDGPLLAEGDVVVLSLHALIHDLEGLAAHSGDAAAWLDIANRALSARRVLWLA